MAFENCPWPPAGISAGHGQFSKAIDTLFAALDIATGKLSADKCYQKHTNAEFVDFLGLITAA